MVYKKTIIFIWDDYSFRTLSYLEKLINYTLNITREQISLLIKLDRKAQYELYKDCFGYMMSYISKISKRSSSSGGCS